MRRRPADSAHGSDRGRRRRDRLFAQLGPDYRRTVLFGWRVSLVQEASVATKTVAAHSRRAFSGAGAAPGQARHSARSPINPPAEGCRARQLDLQGPVPSSVSGSAGWSRVSPQGVVHGASRVDRRGRLGELEPDTSARGPADAAAPARRGPRSGRRPHRGSSAGRRADMCSAKCRFVASTLLPANGSGQLSMR